MEYDLQAYFSDHSPNIVKCYGLFPPIAGHPAMIFQELVSGGNLLHYVALGRFTAKMSRLIIW